MSIPKLFLVHLKNLSEPKNLTTLKSNFEEADGLGVSSYCLIYILCSPSRIEPQQDHAVINSGDTWEVNCTGEAPLEWEYSNRYGKVVQLPTLWFLKVRLKVCLQQRRYYIESRRSQIKGFRPSGLKVVIPNWHNQSNPNSPEF